jgi:hypothetical protein
MDHILYLEQNNCNIWCISFFVIIFFFQKPGGGEDAWLLPPCQQAQHTRMSMLQTCRAFTRLTKITPLPCQLSSLHPDAIRQTEMLFAHFSLVRGKGYLILLCLTI